ncbi:Flavin reductase like domain [Carpediemonas membranifera]|uniref:Flavin reductase like domain n=1 Tax=Carpediemonas membranifera TaxID=201153 RepID=A0A8J6AWR6_9EUKA|nr:Flavin reductase like domain [Carpediemonas membranifera]|eukprot:KAG9390243.1 Flavin reductase like domain [Carpediemonas membranifera]
MALMNITELPSLEELDEEGGVDIDYSDWKSATSPLKQVDFPVAWSNRDNSRFPLIVVEDEKGIPIAIPRVPMLCSIDPAFIAFPIGNRRRVAKIIIEQAAAFSVNYIDRDLNDIETVMDEYWDVAIEEADADADAATKTGLLSDHRLTIREAKAATAAAPVVTETICAFVCTVHQMVPLGDHTLVIAKVDGSFVPNKGRRPRSDRSDDGKLIKKMGRRSSLIQ